MKLMMHFMLKFLLPVSLAIPALSQVTIPLYPGAIPNERKVADEETYSEKHGVSLKVSKPTLTIYFPEQDKNTGISIIICPGGGYGGLVMKREGHDMAKMLAESGITAFVLKYRLPSDRTMVDKSIGPLQDAQMAIMTLRQRATEWKINPERIGIMGFSAGGHLASTAGTHFQRRTIGAENQISLRPDFMVLVYPVISFSNAIGHTGTRDNLLGKEPDAEKIRQYSNELQVTTQTPPAFITHAGDDELVNVKNSISFYEALQENNIPSSLHIYSKGGHGFLKIPPRDHWINEMMYWIKSNGWLSDRKN